MTLLNPSDFVFGIVTTFGTYVVILVTKFILDMENLFISDWIQ